MSQPLIFSDDEDTPRFPEQLRALNVAPLVPGAVPGTSAVDKENVAWKAGDRVKAETDSAAADTYAFAASPVKRPPGRVLFRDTPDNIDEEPPAPEIKQEEEDIKPLFQLTPDKPKDEDEKDENKFTPSTAKTPRSAASTRRRKILRQIKTEMAENEKKRWARGEDPDFVFIGEDEPRTLDATPARTLRSATRTSRITYRNLDWSSDASDRKRSRNAEYFVDESEEERELEKLVKEAEREERRVERVKKRKRTRERMESISSAGATVHTIAAFSLSDDEPLAVIAKRTRMEAAQEKEDGEYKEARSKKRKEAGNANTPVVVTRTKRIKVEERDSDDDSLATIAKRNKERAKSTDAPAGAPAAKKIKEEAKDSDDESLATIAKRLKAGAENPDTPVVTAASNKKIKEEAKDADDEPLATIALKIKIEAEDEDEEREHSPQL